MTIQYFDVGPGSHIKNSADLIDAIGPATRDGYRQMAEALQRMADDDEMWEDDDADAE